MQTLPRTPVVLLALALLAGGASAQSLEDGLVGHWTLDEGSGTTVYDTSPLGLTGYLYGGHFIAGGAPLITGNPSSLVFNGAGDYVNTEPPSDYSGVTDFFSMAFWANPTAERLSTPESAAGAGGLTGQRYAIGPADGKLWYDKSEAGTGVSVGTNGISVVAFNHNSNIATILVWDQPVSGWTHVAVVFQARKPSLWVNGVMVRESASVSAYDLHPSAYLGGSYDVTGPYAGGLDEARIYNRPISGDEIKALAAGRNAPDSEAPAMVTLSPGAVTHDSITLSWTAPADDGSNAVSGRATAYELRTSGVAIATEGNFNAAVRVENLPAPGEPNQPQSITIRRLRPNLPFHFSLRAVDAVGQWSPLAADLLVATPDDRQGPAAVVLSVASVSDDTVTLTWTAPGDDGMAGTAESYDLRYSQGGEIRSDADFDAATSVSGLPAPLTGGAAQSFTVTGLASHQKYSFSLRASDLKPNWSARSNTVAVTTLSGGSTGATAPCAARGQGAFWGVALGIAMVVIARRGRSS